MDVKEYLERLKEKGVLKVLAQFPRIWKEGSYKEIYLMNNSVRVGKGFFVNPLRIEVVSVDPVSNKRLVGTQKILLTLGHMK